MSEAEARLIGKKIVAVRLMTDDEVDEQGWNRSTAVLVLDDGTKLYPSRDEVGNDSGALFGETAKGECFGVYP